MGVINSSLASDLGYNGIDYEVKRLVQREFLAGMTLTSSRHQNVDTSWWQTGGSTISWMNGICSLPVYSLFSRVYYSGPHRSPCIKFQLLFFAATGVLTGYVLSSKTRWTFLPYLASEHGSLQVQWDEPSLQVILGQRYLKRPFFGSTAARFIL